MAAEPSGPGPFSGKGGYLLIGLALLAADQWTKWAVERSLPLYSTTPVFPGFNVSHLLNTGVAFGLFPAEGSPAGTLVLTALGLVALGVVLLYFARTPTGDRVLLLALALILGGAVGNLTDRIAQGGVTDFLDFYVGTYHWHTFNVADAGITVGIVLMAADVLLRRRHDSTGHEPAS